jgi:transcriptional regulator CtsR
MMKDPDVAKQISELMLDVSDRISQSAASTISQCSAEEHAAYQRAAAKVLAAVQQEVLGPLFAEHPSLRPVGWKMTVAPAGESRSLGGIIQPV